MRGANLTVASAAILAFSVAPAIAQQPASDQRDEIIVTALKREQSLQDVPASVTALNADRLAASGIVSSFDLQQVVPGLSISLANRETNVAIRGVANNVRSVGSDPSNAVHIDGIYLPQSSMVLTEFFDISRVEVLKGPEGTLYGRNATGGAINVITKDPREGFSGDGFIGAGSLGLVRGQAAVNAGNDQVAARLALAYTKDDGYTKNLQRNSDLDANDLFGVRGKARFQLTPNLDATVLAQITRDDGSVGYGVSNDPSFPLSLYPYGGATSVGLNGRAEQRVDARNIRLDSPMASRRDADIYGLTVNWNLGRVTVRSITGATKYDAGDIQDNDFTGRLLGTQSTTTTVDTVSQEFQIFNNEPGKFEWTVGAFFYEDDGAQFLLWQLWNEDNFFGPPDPGTLARVNTTNKTSSQAIFGQGTYKFTDRFSLLLGGRYTQDEKTGVQTNFRRSTTRSVNDSWDSFTPKAQIQYKANDNVLAYAGVTKGFKSGGFNLLAAAPALFNPEEVIAYEAGVKTSSAGGRFVANAAAFYYDYTNLQLRTLVVGSGAVTATVSNAAAAEVTGLEVYTSGRFTDALSVDIAATYLDTSLENFISPTNRRNLSGSPLPLSPKWSGVLGVNAEFPLLGGEARARVEAAFRTKTIFPLSIDQTFNFDEDSTVLNATARWTPASGRYYVEIIGRNLGDELYRTQRSDIPGVSVFEGFGPPRTGEIRLGFNF